MSKYGKTILKEFKSGFGRFIAIMAIIALGVGFLIGVLQATPDMEKSMHEYYLAESAYDIDVKSVVGYTAEDIEAIKALEDENGDPVVQDVMPVLSTDVPATAAGEEVVARVVYADEENATAPLNRRTLVEGSLPAEGLQDAAGNEIPLERQVLAERANYNFVSLAVGDTVTLQAEGGQYGDVYAQTEFTVVGIVSSPDYYYRDASEQTTLGTGVIGAVLYVNAGVYDLDKESMSLFGILGNETFVHMIDPEAQTYKIEYTDCWVTVAGSSAYERLSDEYKSYVLERAEYIAALGEERSAPLNDLFTKAEEGVYGSLIGSMVGALPEARWLTLDRASTNVSYVSFDMNVAKVEDIAGIFPIFFIVVAALVAFTSMTRMVEEDRMQIGTLKALGYSPARIVAKYLIYCCIASLIGCAAGILIGFSLLPTIFWEAYRTLYYLPSLNLAFSPWFAIAVVGIALAGTVLVTLAACWSSLRERPSKLMQPKAPKPGKRVLLERVPFLWKPLKFKWKATIRNIFRYKKNMILTIISVMGCTALILVGFGLSDSVGAASQYQYGDVIRYESSIGYNASLYEEGNGGELDAFLQEAEDSLAVYVDESATLVIPQKGGNATETVTLYLVEDDAVFGEFISLHERGSKETISIADDMQGWIVLPENIASVYDLHAGDAVLLDGHMLGVRAVCESYTGGNVFMGKGAYEALFRGGAQLTPNTLLVKSNVGRSGVDAVTKDLLTDQAVNSVEFIYSSLSVFENLSDMMGLIIAVLVVSAGALAAIVLYNLTNINIEERQREIATLRVLGYRKWEVAGYIYRESAILTVVGTLFGLLLGWLLHLYIVTNVNSVAMMFGRVIGGLSYLWAFLLTIAFAVIVYAFMLIKLNKISMTDSLKSNE